MILPPCSAASGPDLRAESLAMSVDDQRLSPDLSSDPHPFLIRVIRVCSEKIRVIRVIRVCSKRIRAIRVRS